MAGILIPILPKRSFDFSSTTVGTAQHLVLVERIDISQYIDGILAVRVHSLTLNGADILELDLFGDGYSGQDPSMDFVTTSNLFPDMLLNSAPGLFTYGGTVLGQFVRLVLSAFHATAGTMSATLSADLVLRSPDPSR